LIRSIARDAQRNNNRFSSLVLGVVRSEPFQMNVKLQISENVTPNESKPDQEARLSNLSKSTKEKQ